MLLKDASRAMRRRFEAKTADFGLSATQWRLLVLIQTRGPMTQAALAEELDVEPMSVSRLIDRMEAGGWVRRVVHPGDRRARLVETTDKADATRPVVQRIAEGIYDEALARLSDDERRVFHRALLCVIETLNAPDADPAPGPGAEALPRSETET